MVTTAHVQMPVEFPTEIALPAQTLVACRRETAAHVQIHAACPTATVAHVPMPVVCPTAIVAHVQMRVVCPTATIAHVQGVTEFLTVGSWMTPVVIAAVTAVDVKAVTVSRTAIL
jgi:hypothetical protein